MKRWPVVVAGLLLDWPGPVLADVLEVLSHKTFGGALDAAEGATRPRAQTCALLPGACGQVYRVLVVSTRAHAAATTHILRSVRRLSLAPA
jgi:hypothetical protein